ncbi:MAG: hypothetical protein ABW049_05485 [Spongiibacteraceae bacterium]
MILRIGKSLLRLGFLFALPAAADPHPHAFAGIETYLIESPSATVTDLSGLAICRGQLLAVSDKISDTIFAITVVDGRASIAPALHIPPPPQRKTSYHAPANLLYRLDAARYADRLDWEGIACRGDTIYLLSERNNAVLKLAGNSSSWLPVDWYEPLYRTGFLHTYNAFVEGIALRDDNTFLIAIEREPRGIMTLQRDAADAWKITASALSNDKPLPFRAGNPDVADIAIHRDSAFTLERNASAICRRDAQTLRTDSCFSYFDIEDDARWRYADSNFGIGEGLAMDDQWIYIVFDSNDKTRIDAADDHRSLLLRIPLPLSWRMPR